MSQRNANAAPTSGSRASARRLRPSIGLIGGLASGLILGSCVWGEPYVKPYVASEREVCRFMGMPCPPDCSRFYNDGTDEWINCMGVPYK